MTTNTLDEGYIKFELHCLDREISFPEETAALNHWRTECWDRKLIGMYPGPERIGFGNISVRLPDGRFLISASRTGGLRELDAQQFVVVNRYSLPTNELWCEGKSEPSSESLTHAAFYAARSDILAIVHIHNLAMWEKYINVMPTSLAEVAYGTPEMALEVERLFAEKQLGETGIVVMGGHREGLISFAHDLETACKLLFDAQK